MLNFNEINWTKRNSSAKKESREHRQEEENEKSNPGPLRLRLKELPSIQLLTLHKEKEMVAFRKLSPALAVAALLFGSVSAYAQGTPLSCQANTGVAPT